MIGQSHPYTSANFVPQTSSPTKGSGPTAPPPALSIAELLTLLGMITTDFECISVSVRERAESLGGMYPQPIASDIAPPNGDFVSTFDHLVQRLAAARDATTRAIAQLDHALHG